MIIVDEQDAEHSIMAGDVIILMPMLALKAIENVLPGSLTIMCPELLHRTFGANCPLYYTNWPNKNDSLDQRRYFIFSSLV